MNIQTNVKDRYGNKLNTDFGKPTLQQSIESWCLVNELIKLGYPHNFQAERKDIAEYGYDISRIVDKANAIIAKEE